MTRILHRVSNSDLPVAVGGRGVELVARDGRRYLDACGGAAVSCLGHGHPDVREAMHRQIDTIAYAHTSFFTTEAAEELADVLVADAPAGLARVYFLSGGSEANETALKLARQYYIEVGQPQRRHVIARRQSYHGNTLAALAVSGNAGRRRLYEPLLVEAHHVDPCFAYHEQAPGESDGDYAARAAGSLEAKILELGPDTVMAFLAETVVGATTGAVPPVVDYLRRVRAICDRYGVLLILDEVMCGMGRTGTLHACEQDGVVPDLLTVAKGLGGGYQPIGAVLIAGFIADAIARGSGAFQHGHTYIGHPVACAAALAVQRVIRRDRLLHNVVAMGRVLDDQLTRRLGDHPHVGDIRGRGLFRGVELVRDRERKTPFDPHLDVAGAIKRAALDRGLMVYPGRGTVDGTRGDHILLAPPFIIDAATVDDVVNRLAGAIDAALHQVATRSAQRPAV